MKIKEKISKIITRLQSPEIIFLLFGLFFGTILVFVTPPFQAPDEGAHFKRAYQISSGQIVAKKRNGSVGGVIPLSITKLENYFMRLADKKTKITYQEIIDKMSIDLDPTETFFGHFPNTSLYSPVPYLPQSIGIAIGRLLNFHTLNLLYLGRLLNLICWTLLTYLAIKITPILKWIFVLLSLMPMTIFLAASLSADPILISASFLLIACTLKYAQPNYKISFWKYYSCVPSRQLSFFQNKVIFFCHYCCYS
jgi:uncharacterized membrane protein